MHAPVFKLTCLLLQCFISGLLFYINNNLLGILHVNDQTSNPNFKPTITIGAPLALTVMMGTCDAPYSHGAESISFKSLNYLDRYY